MKRATVCAFAFSLIVMFGLSACDNGVSVVVATPIPPDVTFHTYRHPSGVFSLRLPPDWSVRDVSQQDSIRVEFSPPGNTGLPLSVYIINTGKPLDAATFLDDINHYQTVINGDPNVYHEVSRNAFGDGSWRLVGVRQTAIGPRQLNTFMQADGSFLSAVEVDVTGADDTTLQTLRAIVNTYKVDSSVIMNAGNIQIPDTSASIASSGVLVFDGNYAWTNPQGIFIVNGEVTNQSGGPLEAILVTAVLYDAQNNPLVRQQDVLAVDVLENGGKAPFSIHFRGGKPSQAVRYELQSSGRNADESAKTHLTKDNFVRGNEKAIYNSSGYLTVSGDVVNATKGLARYVKATVTIFDDQAHVVAADSVFLSKSDLLPGEVGHLEVVFYELGGSAQRYDIRLDGTASESQ